MALLGCGDSSSGTEGASLKPDELQKQRAATMVDDGSKSPKPSADSAAKGAPGAPGGGAR